MNLLRASQLALATFSTLAALAFQGGAQAQVTLPSLPLGNPDPASDYGTLLNQWYVSFNRVNASTFIDGALTNNGNERLFPSPDALARTAETFQTVGNKTATASSRVSATSMGAAATAIDPIEPTSTRTVGISYSALSYWAVLDRNVPVTFDLKLDGTLRTTGDRSAGADASGAAVAVLAHGSEANFNNASQAALFGAAGIDVNAEGEALLAQLSTLRPSTQTHLDAFGAQSDRSSSGVDVNTMLHVTASGTEIHCDTPVSPACGRYFYFMGVFLFTGAQNGGLADFSHTLSVSSFSVNGAAAQPFLPTSPVPEPASALLLAAGLIGLRLRRR